MKRTASPVPEYGSVDVGPWMEKWGIPVSGESEHFMDNARAKGTTWKDWGAAWRNWQRMSAKFAKERGGSGSSGVAGAWGPPWKPNQNNPDLNRLPEVKDWDPIQVVDIAAAQLALAQTRSNPVQRRGNYDVG